MSRVGISRYSAAVALIVGCLAPVHRGHANQAVYEVGTDPAIGFNLISWWDFGSNGASTWQSAVQSLYDAGFREVSISPVRYVTVGTGVISSSGQKTPQLSDIAAGVARAKSLGMRVTLNPFVEPSNGTWRGFYNPSPSSTEGIQFWSDYSSYVGAVAQVANTYGIDAMTIGTELKALDDNSANLSNWGSVIAAARNSYHGPLGYAANWDDYQNNNLRTAILDDSRIDFIGIDSYFTNMATNSQADASGTYPNSTFINTMTTAWNNKLNNEILPYAAARKGGAGMPVAFTEVGYLPYNRTSVSPQNSSNQPVDTDEQIMAFNGLLNALDGRGNLFRSADVWSWAMPGSDGNIWNMDTTLPADQPNNVPASQWLAQFAGTAVYPFAGDFNRNSNVDGGDYVAWRKNQGKYVLQYSGADGNGNGIVDSPDFNVWRAHVGSLAGGGTSTAASIPEPASAWLALIAISGVISRRQRKLVG
jgi:hypothetical protein